MDKSNEGALTSDEMAELEVELNGYANIANVLSVMHFQDREALRKPSPESLRDPPIRESGGCEEK
jgi:hypothetical protein